MRVVVVEAKAHADHAEPSQMTFQKFSMYHAKELILYQITMVMNFAFSNLQKRKVY